jgi:hypothetical protein
MRLTLVALLTLALFLAGVQAQPARRGVYVVYVPMGRLPEPTPTPTATLAATATTIAPTATATSIPATPTNTTIPATPTRNPAQCAPEYPTVCIPPPPPDLDCGDISFRRFTVLPPDRHNFDSDNDGIGCESV